jgi:Uncharacterized protein conserved in bacteria (DUF2188)
MAKLRKFTLSQNASGRWPLTNDSSNRVVHIFKTKQNATKGGVMKKLLSKEGGSVKIQKENGRIQEERTYPGSKDPRSSKGKVAFTCHTSPVTRHCFIERAGEEGIASRHCASVQARSCESAANESRELLSPLGFED